MLAVLLGLGAWQVQRLDWKLGLIKLIDQRVREPAQDVASLDLADANYRHVFASGLFKNAHTYYLFALSTTGVGGYDALTPFALADGRFVLVNRGWIPYDQKKQGEGGLKTPYGEIEGLTTLTGILRAPEHHWTQPKNAPASNDWYWVDLETMAAIAGISNFIPYVLEVDAYGGGEGYPKGGQTRVALTNNHFVYALTWFGLALALMVIYGLSAFPKNAED